MEPEVDKVKGSGRLAFLDQGAQHTIKWESDSSTSPSPQFLTLRINCLDRDSREFEQTVSLELGEDNKYRILETNYG